MATLRVTEDSFEQTVQDGIVLLEFWAAWCGPCRAFAPVFEAAATRHPDVVLGKVDTEAEPGLAAAFRIRSIPTLLVFRDGILLGAQAGSLPPSMLEDLIARVRGLDMQSVRKQIAERAQATGAASSATTSASISQGAV